MSDWRDRGRDVLKSTGYVAPEDREYEITLNDGTYLGDVSYRAYNAIKEDRLDSYTPANDSEKKVIEGIKVYSAQKNAEAEAAAKQEKINSNPVLKKYNIDPDNFTQSDFEKWAEEHGFEYRMAGNDLTGAEMKWMPKSDPNAPWYHFGFSVIPTKQEREEKEVLETLAKNNQRKTISQTDRGAARAAVVNFIDAATFGGVSAYAEWDTKKDYQKAGLNPDDYAGVKQMDAKTIDEHKVASFAGNIAGSMVSLGALGKGVSTVTKGLSWVANSPQWVQSAINSGITFAISGGLETTFDGGSLKDILISSSTNLVGGSVGGALSSKVGAVGEKILFDKGLQHKIIPEIIRNGLSSSAFAGGKTASTYFLYPEEYRPSTEEMINDLGVAFAFGAVSSGIHTIKTSTQNRKILDDL